MGLIRSCVAIWAAAHKPTLKNQQVGIATAPTASISSAMAFGFVEAGHQNVLTLSPCLKTLLQELQVMAARKRARHTPGVALHRRIKPFGLEIKVIERNHLDREVKCPCGSFNPLPQGGFPATWQSTESEQSALSLPLLAQVQKRQTNRPEPIRCRLRMPVIDGDPMPPRVALQCRPTLKVAQLEMLQQPLLILAGNDALALRIQL